MPDLPTHVPSDRVYRKTPLGQEEMKTRALRLDGKLRALLLMVNGERPQAALLAQLSGTGLEPDSTDFLLAAGLIEAVAAHTSGAAEVMQEAPADGFSADSLADSSTGPVAGSIGSAVPKTPSDAALSYQALYRCFTDCISTHLGLRGYLLEVKVEKAGNPAALAGLRPALHAALVKARGEPAAREIIAELDALIARDGLGTPDVGEPDPNAGDVAGGARFW